MLPPQKPTATDQNIFSLGRVLQSLREENDVDVLIETTISYLKEQFDYKLVWIALYDRLNHILFGKGGLSPVAESSYLRQRVVLSPGDLLEQVVIEQRSIGVADLKAENRAEQWQGFAAKFNIQGTIILPIRYKDRCLGVVLMGSERWGYMLGGEAKARLTMVLGELGAALYQSEIDLQQKQTKRLDEPLLRLLESVRTLSHLEQKLEVVVQATHEFVSPTRTKIYWFDREKRYFWLRLSDRHSKTQGEQHSSGITVQELNDFYYALSVNQIVSIGEGRSSLKSAFTVKLLQRLNVRSLLAAPIVWQKDLLGFMAVEAREARIWSDVEKNFVVGAAGLLSLAAPTEGMETTIKQVQDDAQLTSQIAKAICKDSDTLEILHLCATRVLERLGVSRFLLLDLDTDQNQYQILYQNQPRNRRNLISSLDALKELDWQLLQHSSEAVGIEDAEEDLKFYNWRSELVENGVHSFLISNCTQGRAPESLLLVTTETPRYWKTQEKELLQAVSQQIGVIVRQWRLHQVTEQQEKILRSFQQCFRILERTQTSIPQPAHQFERAALEQIASVLGCPLALLLSWTPEQDVAEIIPGVIANNQFTVNTDAIVPIQTEPLIYWAFATDGLLAIKADDLPEQTKKWLNGSGIGQVLVMALRTSADYQPTGVVLIADRAERQWSEQSLTALESLICQFAWSRWHLHLTQILQSTTNNLQQLNWYKHRRLEEMQRTLVLLLSQMYDLGVPTTEITHTRHLQLLRQIDAVAGSMTPMLKLEQWQVCVTKETVPIASLLKRSLERVELLLKQQKLWVGVHGLGQPIDSTEKTYSTLYNSSDGSKTQAMTVIGDIVKIELVLYELLINACRRSVGGGRIDIWCRRMDEQLLEVSVTDNGVIEAQLLEELHQDAPKKVLSPSSLSQPPGLHLLICQNLMQLMGGELHFYQLPDGRVVSRLLLPLTG
ncbi:MULTISPECIES: GAF domain-containing sensor histidine kinase [Nostocales]|uniref:ATP-binding protein n=3 Tax=Nostocales TaxID=1161 RepID=A0A0C1N979_9CYAN|nr:GAF domain-containing protein [Tolypothrix bouteillei]KAF3887259.1 ATP-binding protein [Tolypothrix bouteillei VB521301]